MRKNVTPEQELALMIPVVNAMTAAENAGVRMTGGPTLFESGRYSIEWDSEADRWTLVAETDDAIHVCSFNQRREECREGDVCEQCWDRMCLLEDLDER